MRLALLVVLLATLVAWADDYKKYGEWVGGMATLSVGVELRADGSRRAQLRFATSGAATDLKFSATQWQDVSKAIKAAIAASRELKEGENGPATEIAGLKVRAVRQRPEPGVQISALEPKSDATIVVHDYASLMGALNDVSSVLRSER